VPKPVTPAKAGVQKYPKSLDPGLRRDDKIGKNLTFYGSINIEHRTPNFEKGPAGPVDLINHRLAAGGDHSSRFDVERSMFNVQMDSGV